MFRFVRKGGCRSIFWRDLFLGLLAWYCGDQAASYIALKAPFQLSRWAHFHTLLLYRPQLIILPLLFLMICCSLLYLLMKNHGKAFWNRRGVFDTLRLLHGCLLSFALYILLLQTIKTPIPVLLYFLGCFLINLFRYIKHRALHQEIAQITGKK